MQSREARDHSVIRDRIARDSIELLEYARRAVAPTLVREQIAELTKSAERSVERDAIGEDSSATSQVGGSAMSVAVYQVGAIDGEFLESLFTPTFNQRDITSLANFRAYVRSFGTLGHSPFSVEMEGPQSGGDPELAETLRQLSRTKHGRDRQAVDEEIRATYEAYKGLHTAGDLE